MELKAGRRARIFGGIIGVGLLLGLPAAAAGVSVSVAWDPNTETDLAGYMFYYGQASGNYQFSVDAGNQTTFTLSGLAVGQTYHFAVTAYDSFGNQSDFSNEVTATIPVSIAYEVPAGTFGNQEWAGSLGMDFDVNIPVTVTELGVFDSGSDGLNQTITAQLYNRTNTAMPLAELIFTPTDPGTLVGGSRFKPLATPLELPAGFQGTIVAFGYGPGEPNGNVGNWTINDEGRALSFVNGARFCGCTTFPTSLDWGPANRYAAGTFMYAPISPPGTLVSPSGQP